MAMFDSNMAIGSSDAFKNLMRHRAGRPNRKVQSCCSQLRFLARMTPIQRIFCSASLETFHAQRCLSSKTVDFSRFANAAPR